MVRRMVRIFMVLGLAAMVGGAVVSQDRTIGIGNGHYALLLDARGAECLDGIVFDKWLVLDEGHWKLSWLFHLPTVDCYPLTTRVFLPWWLLILSWSLLHAVVFRFTRRRKAGAGFPVEPSATRVEAHDGTMPP